MGELPALPRRARVATDFGVGTAVLGVPDGPEMHLRGPQPASSYRSTRRRAGSTRLTTRDDRHPEDGTLPSDRVAIHVRDRPTQAEPGDLGGRRHLDSRRGARLLRARGRPRSTGLKGSSCVAPTDGVRGATPLPRARVRAARRLGVGEPTRCRRCRTGRGRTSHDAVDERRTRSVLECVLRVVTRTTSSTCSRWSIRRSCCSRPTRPTRTRITSIGCSSCLPDVPAGKLAIAELIGASRHEIAELERAGVDAVLVTAGDVASARR